MRLRPFWLVSAALVAVWLATAAQTGNVANIRRLNLFLADGTNCTVVTGSGAPEGAVVGKPCDRYFRKDGPPWQYVKDTGTGTDNSGWIDMIAAGGAPIGAQYWTGAADGTLSAEKNLGALSTALVINTGGVPSAYGGGSCTNQFPRSLSAVGAFTCASVADADITGLAWSKVSSTPTTFAGYGIADSFANWLTAATATRSGNTAQVVTTTGTLTSGDCVKIDASGNFVANGAACGAGSGDFSTNTTASATGEIVEFNGTAGKTGQRSFAALSGPASTLKTFTLPNASATILTDNALVTTAQGGTGLGAQSDDTLLVSNGTIWQAKALADCTDTGGNHLNYTASTNAFSCGTSGGGGGGSALSGITAASGANTIASGNNYEQIWNWALTTAAKVAFAFGETTAATNGASNLQAILGVNTLASSTAVALYIKNLGGAAGIRVDDAGSDTTSFYVDEDGEVGIHCASGGVTHSLELCDGIIGLDDAASGVNMTRMRLTNATPELTSVGALDLVLSTDTGTERIRTKATTGQVVINGTSTSTLGISMLNVGTGANIWNAGNYALISFGYGSIGAATTPSFIGFKTTSGAGNTKGDLIFGTRADTSSVPTIRLRIDDQGTVAFPSTTPTPAVTNTSANSCGTTAATIAGNNNVGTITVGATAGTSCTVTFTTTAPVAWVCMVEDQTTAGAVQATPSSTTVSVFAGTFTAADKLDYICFAR